MAAPPRPAAGGGGRGPRSGDRHVSTFSAPTSAAPSCTTGTTPRARSRPPPCRSCSRRRWRRPPMRPRWCSRIEQPHLSRARCAREPAGASPARARGRARGGGGAVRRALAGDARSRCSASSRPAAPTCRSTRTTRPSGSPSCSRTPRAPVLLTHSTLLERLPQHHARIVRLDADWPAIAAQPDDRPRSPASTRTTPPMSSTPRAPPGTPKGVSVTHGGIPNLAAVQIDRFAITSAARILQFASQSFDAALWEMASALMGGAALVLIAPGKRSGDALARLDPRARRHPCDVAAGAADGPACGPAARDAGRRRRGLLARMRWRAGRRAGG